MKKDYIIFNTPTEPEEFKQLWTQIPSVTKDKPCSHPGCKHHVTHPCEKCGRTAGS